MRIVTAAEMRSLEEAAFARGVDAPALMQQAGAGVAHVVRELAPHRGAQIVVLLGPGNNGGDGVVAARALAAEAYHVSVWSVTERADLDTPGRHSLTVIEDMDALKAALRDADVVLDALLGTGARPGLPEQMATVTRMVNDDVRGAARVVAVDVPTGVDATTGEADSDAIRAHVTATLGSPKRGCFVPPGNRYAGKIVVIDLGLGEPAEPGPEMTTDADVRSRMPRREADAHKSDAGTLLVIAGAPTYLGAPGFVAEAAMRAGVGLAMLAVPRSIVGALAVAIREATFLPLPDDSDRALKQIRESVERYTAGVIGPGLGREEETQQFLARLMGISAGRVRPQLGFGAPNREQEREVILPESLPLLFDADGLNWLSEIENWWEQIRNPLVLTPHPGEMARLAKIDIADVKRDPLTVATEYAKKWHQVVVLKGGPTVVAAPDGRLWAAPGGNPGLATGGTGDVLAGIIGGLLGQGLSPLDAAVAGVHLGWRAADRAVADVGMYGLIARDLFPAIAYALREIMGV